MVLRSRSGNQTENAFESFGSTLCCQKTRPGYCRETSKAAIKNKLHRFLQYFSTLFKKQQKHKQSSDSHLKCHQSADSQVSRQRPRLLSLRLVFVSPLPLLLGTEAARRGSSSPPEPVGGARVLGDLSARVRFLRRRRRESRRLSERSPHANLFQPSPTSVVLWPGVNVGTAENPPTGRALTFTDINTPPPTYYSSSSLFDSASVQQWWELPPANCFFFFSTAPVSSAAKRRTRQHPFGRLAGIQRGF